MLSSQHRLGRKGRSRGGHGVPKDVWDQYEFDHYIPLSIGGSDSPKNLFLQRLDAAHEKDKLEDQLFNDLAAGKITQADAVAQIRSWKP